MNSLTRLLRPAMPLALVGLLVATLAACPADTPATGTPDGVSGDTSFPKTDTDATTTSDTPAGDQGSDSGPSTPLCLTDADCAGTAGTVCACTGECIAVTTNPCNTDINCSPGNFCDACTGHCAALANLCEECTGLSGCAGGGSCMPFSDGGTYCGKACITDAGCATGYACVDTGAKDKQCVPKSGNCKDLGLCEDDGECPDGEICNATLKVCAPGCTDDPSCPGSQLCVAARCSDPCITTDECEAPRECVEGRCKIPGACDSSVECTEPATYCNKNTGMCVPGCLEADHCKEATQTCENGLCVPKGCTHNYQCSFEEECAKATGECVPMAKDHCAVCDTEAENQCGGDPNLCASFQDAEEQPQGDFCLLECEDDEVDKCPQGYGCQQIEAEGINGFYCTRQCFQTPAGVP